MPQSGQWVWCRKSDCTEPETVTMQRNFTCVPSEPTYNPQDVRSVLTGNVKENAVRNAKEMSLVDATFNKWNPAVERLRQNSINDLLKWDEARELADARYEILHFRTTKCPFGDECPRKNSGSCDRAHAPFQLRRCPVYPDGKIRYSNIKCPNITPCTYECQMGSSCPFAHTISEITYHPFVYRTRLCQLVDCKDLGCSFAHSKRDLRNGMELCGARNYGKTRFCASYPAPCDKAACKWAHSRDEITAELLTEAEETYLNDDVTEEIPPDKLAFFLMCRYKTMHCPIGKPHDWHKCPYAHGTQDVRRDPRVHKYSAVPCVHWKSNRDHQCPHRNDCKHAHGLKESMYHPDNVYKRQCVDFAQLGHCRLGKRCPHYHLADKKGSDYNSEESTVVSRLENRITNDVESKWDCDAKIRRIFVHFDKDGDGFLSHDVELREFVSATGCSPLCKEEYETMCTILEQSMKLSRPDIGLSIKEFEASYQLFGAETIDRDYDFVFHTNQAAINAEQRALSRSYASAIAAC